MEIENPENSFFEPQYTLESVDRVQGILMAEMYAFVFFFFALLMGDFSISQQLIIYPLLFVVVILFVVLSVKFLYIEEM